MVTLSTKTAAFVLPIALWVSLLLLATIPVAALWIAFSTGWMTRAESEAVIRVERALLLLNNTPATLVTTFLSTLPAVVTAVSFRGAGRKQSILSLHGLAVVAAFVVIGAVALHNVIVFNAANTELLSSLDGGAALLSTIHATSDRVLTISIGTVALLLGLTIEVKS